MRIGIKSMFSFTICSLICGAASTQNRWHILPEGGIEWSVDKQLPHADHIEMSGKQVSLWVQYEADTASALHLTRTLVFPSFRLLPNNTHASMMYNIADRDLPRILINGRPMKADIYYGVPVNDFPEKVISIRHKGIMETNSRLLSKNIDLQLKRCLFPSDNKAMALEKLVFINTGDKPVKIEMEELYKEQQPANSRVVNGPLRFVTGTVGAGEKTVAPGDSAIFGLFYAALRGTDKVASPSLAAEEQGRKDRVAGILSLLQLETPDTLLNTAFAFAKIRATESIFLTKGGYMHGPGGLRYYAAIWANDQAEYVNPFFAFLGDSTGNQSAMNAYRWFAKFMNPDYNPIPSSIIAEGEGTWHGRRDRGDMAMIAYGAGRYALAYGNADSAKVLWPLITWCLEYLQRNLNADGVVHSDSDELEGRFPAGDANLNTSSLYYDALRSAVMLGRNLNAPAALLKQYARQAAALKKNIDRFFGATVEGFNTYRYYAGNTVLRAWIATPLTVDLFDRKAGTIAALFSPRLWTADGLASQAGDSTFWDRSTLYALRGVLAAGETAKALDYLRHYSERRLLGEHVPYPVEAYPEGNQRHLSAESGLYCRVYTEGLFGMRPAGLNSFNCTPRLPASWSFMALRNIHAFGQVFSLEVTRQNKARLQIKVVSAGGAKVYAIKEGETAIVQL
ncbi:MAG TPA: hypothetical protein VGE90_19020 [Chitinophaga sp.]